MSDGRVPVYNVEKQARVNDSGLVWELGTYCGNIS